MNIRREKYLKGQINELKAIIKTTGEMMDRTKPILECVIPFIVEYRDDIESSIEGYGDLQPALDAILEFEESEE